MFQLSIFFALCWQLLKRHHHHIEETFSYKDRVSLGWSRMLVASTFSVYIIWIIEKFVSESLGMGEVFNITLGVSMVILIHGMGYLGLRQSLIFSRPALMPEHLAKKTDSAIENVLQKGKYKSSALTPDLSQALLNELKRVMVSEQAFFNPKLSLPELADKLGVSVNYLSQTMPPPFKRTSIISPLLS
jgi:hypothetical protein